MDTRPLFHCFQLDLSSVTKCVKIQPNKFQGDFQDTFNALLTSVNVIINDTRA